MLFCFFLSLFLCFNLKNFFLTCVFCDDGNDKFLPNNFTPTKLILERKKTNKCARGKNDLFYFDLYHSSHVLVRSYFPIQNDRKSTSSISSVSILPRAVIEPICLADRRSCSPARAKSPCCSIMSRNFSKCLKATWT